MKTIRTDEEAVSPVIGVILMVAIVVILAAVIAAFVFGMAGSAGTSKNVGMTVTVNNTAGDPGVDVLWQGGTDINSMNGINATFDGEDADPVTQTEFNVGEITLIKSPGTDMQGVRVIITGDFTDGSTQVIFDKRF